MILLKSEASFMNTTTTIIYKMELGLNYIYSEEEWEVRHWQRKVLNRFLNTTIWLIAVIVLKHDEPEQIDN